eukprot:TRINITY_DN16629_c0_g1_i14.p1 TRINITY_DN16629_c0_g1~~TRINITY_DN16629_c0_g1_i14.p1  ORF type:complete len:626 (-),score=60.36 TRINITY_DN16629_c0_g1_i14:453-2330(-)
MCIRDRVSTQSTVKAAGDHMVRTRTQLIVVVVGAAMVGAAMLGFLTLQRSITVTTSKALAQMEQRLKDSLGTTVTTQELARVQEKLDAIVKPDATMTTQERARVQEKLDATVTTQELARVQEKLDVFQDATQAWQTVEHAGKHNRMDLLHLRQINHARYLDHRLRILDERLTTTSAFLHAPREIVAGDSLDRFRMVAAQQLQRATGLEAARETLSVLQHQHCHDSPLLFVSPSGGGSGLGAEINTFTRLLSLALVTGRVMVPVGNWSFVSTELCKSSQRDGAALRGEGATSGWECYFNVSSCYHPQRFRSAVHVDHSMPLPDIMAEAKALRRDLIFDPTRFETEWNTQSYFDFDSGQGDVLYDEVATHWSLPRVGLEKEKRTVGVVARNQGIGAELGRMFELHVGQVHGLLVEAVTVLNPDTAKRLTSLRPELLPMSCLRMASCNVLPGTLAMHVRGSDFLSTHDGRFMIPDARYLEAVDHLSEADTTLSTPSSSHEREEPQSRLMVYVATDLATRGAAHFQDLLGSPSRYRSTCPPRWHQPQGGLVCQLLHRSLKAAPSRRRGGLQRARTARRRSDQERSRFGVARHLHAQHLRVWICWNWVQLVLHRRRAHVCAGSHRQSLRP